jgi:DNA ligase D-like protein (predicted 3'-phosphoesterase)
MGLRGVGGWMSGVRRFVVHEHFALRAGLHYDLRLKWGGFLRDWAFRKVPPLECGVKRFGVAQPDHELCWLDYEGEIRSGYGAGVLRIWDKGTYQLLRNEETIIKLYFHGAKLLGKYVLTKFKNGWLLFKTKS